MYNENWLTRSLALHCALSCHVTGGVKCLGQFSFMRRMRRSSDRLQRKKLTCAMALESTVSKRMLCGIIRTHGTRRFQCKTTDRVRHLQTSFN